MPSPPRFVHFVFLLLLSARRCLLARANDETPPKPDDPTPDDLFGNKNQVCAPFTCAKPYVAIAKWPLGITSDGCLGALAGQSGMSGMNYKHIDHCCHMKNACYQICNSNKQTCDSDLKKCMKKSCEDLPGLDPDALASMTEEEVAKEKENCDRVKGIVDLLGNMGGCKEREALQRKSCECVEKTKLESKMERVLRNFYKKYNPEGVDKVPALMEKTDGKRTKFTHILMNLVKKYPEAIKKKVPETPDRNTVKMDL